jgi:hypothetical protein
MRTLVLLLACAHQSATPAASPAPMSEVQVRACDSCRHNLELCNQQRRAESAGGAECMDTFMSCLRTQQLDNMSCQGMN